MPTARKRVSYPAKTDTASDLRAQYENCVFDHPESASTVERVRVTWPVGEGGYGCDKDFKGLYGCL